MYPVRERSKALILLALLQYLLLGQCYYPFPLRNSLFPRQSRLIPSFSYTTAFLTKQQATKSSSDEGGPTINFNELRKNVKDFASATRWRAVTVKTTRISSHESTQIEDLLLMHIPAMTAENLADVLESLGKLNFSLKPANRWKITRSLAIQLNCVSRQMTMREFTCLLVGAARIGVSWSELQATGGTFVASFSDRISSSKDSQLGDVLWSLGSMSVPWSTLSDDLREALMDGIGRVSSKMTAYSLSSSVWALAKMGLQWTSLPNARRAVLLDRLEVLAAGKFSPQQASKVLWALGSMGFQHQHQRNPSTQAAVEQLFFRVASIKKSQMGNAVSSQQALLGIAKIGLSYKSMPTSLKNSLWDQALRVVQGGDERGVSNVVWALGSLGVPSREIPPSICAALLSRIAVVQNQCSAWGLCNTIWGLAKMGFVWDELPDPMRNSISMNVVRLAPEFNPMDTGTLLWSVGTMDLPLPSLPRASYFFEAVMDALYHNLPNMRAQELARSIWGLSAANTAWDDLPVGVRWAINIALRRVGDTLSAQDVANCAYGLSILSFDAENPSDPAIRGANEVLLQATRKAMRTFQSAGSSTGGGTVAAASSPTGAGEGVPAEQEERDERVGQRIDENGMESYGERGKLGQRDGDTRENLASGEGAEEFKASHSSSHSSYGEMALMAEAESVLDRASDDVGGGGEHSSSADTSDGSDVGLAGSWSPSLTRKAARKRQRRESNSAAAAVSSSSSSFATGTNGKRLKARNGSGRKGGRLSDTSSAAAFKGLLQLRIFAHYLNVMRCATDAARIPQELLDTPDAEFMTAMQRQTTLFLEGANRKLKLGSSISSDGASGDSSTRSSSSSSSNSAGDLQLGKGGNVASSSAVISTGSVGRTGMMTMMEGKGGEEDEEEWVAVQGLRCGADQLSGAERASASHLQQRILSSLTQAFADTEKEAGGRGRFAGTGGEIKVIPEVSSFGGMFPVDAAIARNGRIIALLEVDGPHHYRPDGSLRRKDKLKEAMYLRKYPDSSFHRIRWDEENKMGANFLGEELAALVISTAKPDDLVSCGLRAARRAVSDFVTWGLRNSKDFS